jgi:hypothetical protein
MQSWKVNGLRGTGRKVTEQRKSVKVNADKSEGKEGKKKMQERECKCKKRKCREKMWLMQIDRDKQDAREKWNTKYLFCLGF